MSNRSAARGTAAASSIRLTLRTSNAVATSNASPSRCFLFCEGSRAARSARTAAATVSTPPIPKAPPNQRRRPPITSLFQAQEFLMGGEGDVLAQPAPQRLHGHQIRAVTGQRYEFDAQGRGDLPDGLGPVVGRAVPEHDQRALGSLGLQALQHLDRVFTIGPRIGPQPHLAFIVEVEPVERELGRETR